MRREPKTRGYTVRRRLTRVDHTTCSHVRVVYLRLPAERLSLSLATHTKQKPPLPAHMLIGSAHLGWKLAALARWLPRRLTFGCKRQERSPFRSTLARGTRAVPRHRPVSQPRAFALDASLFRSLCCNLRCFAGARAPQPCQAGAAAGAVPTRSTRHAGQVTAKVS
jgi:hypothetical protein